MILLALALAGGGAALYYFKFRKPKADTTGHDDLDEYDFGEDEDGTVSTPSIETLQKQGETAIPFRSTLFANKIVPLKKFATT